MVTTLGQEIPLASTAFSQSTALPLPSTKTNVFGSTVPASTTPVPVLTVTIPAYIDTDYTGTSMIVLFNYNDANGNPQSVSMGAESDTASTIELP